MILKGNKHYKRRLHLSLGISVRRKCKPSFGARLFYFAGGKTPRFRRRKLSFVLSQNTNEQIRSVFFKKGVTAQVASILLQDKARGAENRSVLKYVRI